MPGKQAKKQTVVPVSKKSAGFTAEERAAMKDRIEEMKAETERRTAEEREQEVLAKIAALEPADRALATELHAIIKSNAPSLTPKTWYGMPAYAKDGNVVCFFQSGQKFKTRYATFGFSDKASLDEGNMWPTAFALKKLTPGEVAKIVALLKRAVN